NLIVDAVWGEETPASGVNLVHTYVSRLRHVLDPGREQRGPSAVLAGSPAGYLLRLAAGQLDLLTFYDLLGQARARRGEGDLAGAASAYAAGLTLWHGTPLAGIPGPLADAERGRLSELRVAIVESRAEVMLEPGRHGELVAELSALVGEHPLRERV